MGLCMYPSCMSQAWGVQEDVLRTMREGPRALTAQSPPHCLQLPLSPDLPGPWTLALPLSGPHISLPGQQGSEACVVRVSIDNDHGNLYRSILVRGCAWDMLVAALPLGLGLSSLTSRPLFPAH